MQVVRSGSKVGDTNIEVLYFLAIASAERTIDLTAAYFAPRPPFVEALCEAARRGVRVRILVPGPNTDKAFVRLAGRNVYASMLDCDVEFYEYQPTMLHAKTMVVDDCWCSIGTVNFDNRSFQLNDELTLSIFDAEIAGELSAAFERDLERSERIEPDRWSTRGAPAAGLGEAHGAGPPRALSGAYPPPPCSSDRDHYVRDRAPAPAGVGR